MTNNPFVSLADQTTGLSFFFWRVILFGAFPIAELCFFKLMMPAGVVTVVPSSLRHSFCWKKNSCLSVGSVGNHLFRFGGNLFLVEMLIMVQVLAHELVQNLIPVDRKDYRSLVLVHDALWLVNTVKPILGPHCYDIWGAEVDKYTTPLLKSTPSHILAQYKWKLLFNRFQTIFPPWVNILQHLFNKYSKVLINDFFVDTLL